MGWSRSDWSFVLWLPVVGIAPSGASAHASEQGFVLLLPTDAYILAGVATVAATVALLFFVDARALQRLFAGLEWPGRDMRGLQAKTRALSSLILIWAVFQGLSGPADPLGNPLPLLVWTVWWIVLVSLQGVTGAIWRWVDPFRPIWRPAQGWIRLPRGVGHWPSVAGVIGLSAFLLADPAPSDPARLAKLVAVFWAGLLLGSLVFGRRWAVQADPVRAVMRAYGRVGLLSQGIGRRSVGVFGWKILCRSSPPLSLALLSLLLLGIGSFDGLNETFTWLGFIGVNPLEYPGRSALVGTTLLGLGVICGALVVTFAGAVWLGRAMAGTTGREPVFRSFAPAVLPIALGYHIAHYLPTLLVDIQWTWHAVLAAFGLRDAGAGSLFVTTGFFNTLGTVRVIWLTQAGAVVLGHVVSILLAHAIAVRIFPDGRKALIAHAPLAVFMVIYTVFGLWLLASPRGV